MAYLGKLKNSVIAIVIETDNDTKMIHIFSEEITSVTISESLLNLRENAQIRTEQ